MAAALHIGRATVVRIGKRWVEEGPEAALRDRPHPGAQRKLEGKQAAFLIALACSPPPAGRTCWTRQWLAGWRPVAVRERRTAHDFTPCMQALVEAYGPQADLIRVVLDHLHTYTAAAL